MDRRLLFLALGMFALGTDSFVAVSYTHLRAHETVLDLVCRLLLEKKQKITHLIRHLVHPLALLSQHNHIS